MRPYFAYRDLGIKDATHGRVLAQVIRADEPSKGPIGYGVGGGGASTATVVD